ncbi:unnamed protein product [Caenorhabditis sp. 36 PRJEB53466]|nr:unnamed protein product [Caenorhabditis sp. 36 PRJEB53466]
MDDDDGPPAKLKKRANQTPTATERHARKLEENDIDCEKATLSNITYLAVIGLKALGVADAKVGEVIKTVGDLVGISFRSVPASAKCRNFALTDLTVGRRHVKERLSEYQERGKTVCLASDETTKGAMKLQAFGVHSQDGTFTCVGIDHVAEKSAQTAFEKLCWTVTKLSGASTDFLKKFMVSVTSTMSDSASTEIKFNRLVEAYRNEVIPEVVSNYADMTD